MDKTTKNLINRIAESWSREKDAAQPMALEKEIQYQLGCTFGAALGYANFIRLQWVVRAGKD